MELPQHIKSLKLIVLMKYGAHLYGTNTKDSDTDYKGIYLPTKKQILLNRIPKSISYRTNPNVADKNNKDDIDMEIYSLHYFFKLASSGQTVALDMLYSRFDWPEISSPIWKLIQENRKIFNSKSLNAFIGYARSQAAKYGLKGSRLKAIKKVMNTIKNYDGRTRLSDIWKLLPDGDHLHKIDAEPLNIYQICGKQFHETVHIDHLLPILERQIKIYGNRAKLAEKNDGIDWKAISHSYRISLEMHELISKGTITFPLKEAKFITDIKNGKVDYTIVSTKLDQLMDQCEALMMKSDIQQIVDQDAVDEFLITLISRFRYM